MPHALRRIEKKEGRRLLQNEGPCMARRKPCMRERRSRRIATEALSCSELGLARRKAKPHVPPHPAPCKSQTCQSLSQQNCSTQSCQHTGGMFGSSGAVFTSLSVPAPDVMEVMPDWWEKERAKSGQRSAGSWMITEGGRRIEAGRDAWKCTHRATEMFLWCPVTFPAHWRTTSYPLSWIHTTLQTFVCVLCHGDGSQRKCHTNMIEGMKEEKKKVVTQEYRHRKCMQLEGRKKWAGAVNNVWSHCIHRSIEEKQAKPLHWLQSCSHTCHAMTND